MCGLIPFMVLKANIPSSAPLPTNVKLLFYILRLFFMKKPSNITFHMFSYHFLNKKIETLSFISKSNTAGHVTRPVCSTLSKALQGGNSVKS